jgi:hypothetical protein
MRPRVPIATINAAAAVTSELTRDSAAVPPYLPCNLGQIKALLYQVRNEYPLLEGRLLILHHDLSLLAGRKNRGVSKITLTKLHRGLRVALSI